MAFTYTVTKTTFGNQSVHQYYVTADAASGTIATGLGTITTIQHSAASVVTAASVLYGRVRMNANAAGTSAVAGQIGFSGFTSGDELYVTVYGR